MRPMAIVIILAALAFAVLYFHETRRVDGLLARSTRMMEQDVPGAIAMFQPAMTASDSETFGHATETRHQFYLALLNAAAQRLGVSTFSDSDAANVVAALNAVRESKCLTPDEILNGHKRVLEDARLSRDRLVAEGFLPDFEAYVRFLQQLKEKPILVPSLQPDVAPLIEAATQVDRYPLALRTATFHVRSSMDQGFRGVGLNPPGPGGAAEVDRNADIATWTPGAAESSFRGVLDEIRQFAEQWNRPLPPDLRRLAPAASHNVAMTRFAYAMLSQRRGRQWEMYFLPGVKPVGDASEDELRAAFLQDLFGAFGTAVKEAEQLDPTEPQRTPILLSSHYSLAIAYARLYNRPANAEAEIAAYRGLAPNQPVSASPAQLAPRLIFFD